MNKTRIPWTDLSWNPVTGCLHACSYCYARRMYQRFGRSFKPAFHLERLDQPKKRKEPSKIFVCSVADLFGDWVPQEWINAVLGVVVDCPQHTFQFLTKNPARYVGINWPANCWVGTTVTSSLGEQHLTKHLSDIMIKVSAPVRFLSAEPLLGRLRIGGWKPDWVIIGAQTGPDAMQPNKKWVEDLTRDARACGAAVFYKPNLEWKNPPREFPK